MLCEHVKDVGRSLVTDPERSKDPVEYVQALLDMRDKHEKIITQAWSVSATAGQPNSSNKRSFGQSVAAKLQVIISR